MRTIASAAALLLGVLAAGCTGEVVDGGRTPASVDIVSGNDQQDTVGQELPQPLVVKVVDDAGRPVRDQRVSFRVTRGGGSVSAGSATTDGDGIAQERWTLGTVADSQRVEARAVDAKTGAGVVFATFRAVAVPGAAAAVTPVGPAARQGDAGAALADSLAVRVTDAGGNPVPGAAVTWTVQSGGGAVAPATGTTGADGTARAAWTLGTRVDSVEAVQAAVAGATAAAFTATAAVPADVVLEKLSGDNQSAHYGTILRDSLVVRARLADGRPLRGAVIHWQTAADAWISPGQSVTDAQGLARAAWRLGPSGGGSASATVNGTGTQVGFLATGRSPAREYHTITVGEAHACGTAESGFRTYCWGRNTSGQLGTGDMQSHSFPTQVVTSVYFGSLAAGGSHTCGLAAHWAADRG